MFALGSGPRPARRRARRLAGIGRRPIPIVWLVLVALVVSTAPAMASNRPVRPASEVAGIGSPDAPLAAPAPRQDPAPSAPDEPTAIACTEAAIRAAVGAGGEYVVDCGTLTTIPVSSTFVVTKAVTLDGGKSLVLDGQDARRIFTVEAAGDLTLRNMYLQHGKAEDGGAVHNAWWLTLESVNVRQSTATRYGGGIFNAGWMKLTDAVVELNHADVDGGGIYHSPDAQSLAIGSTAETIDGSGSIISKNSTDGCGGGLALLMSASLVTVSIRENSATQCGGGIWLAASLNLQSSSVERNIVQGRRGTHPGGGIFVSSCRSYGDVVDLEFVDHCTTNPTSLFATDVRVDANVTQCEDEWPFPFVQVFECAAEGGGIAAWGSTLSGRVVATNTLITRNIATVVNRADQATQSRGGGIAVHGASVDLLDSQVGVNAATASENWIRSSDLPGLVANVGSLMIAVAPELAILEAIDIALTLFGEATEVQELWLGSPIPIAVGGGIYNDGDLALGGATRIIGNSIFARELDKESKSAGGGLYAASGATVTLGRAPWVDWTGDIVENRLTTEIGFEDCGMWGCHLANEGAFNCSLDGATWDAGAAPAPVAASYPCYAGDVYRPRPQDDTIPIIGQGLIVVDVFANDREVMRANTGVTWTPSVRYGVGSIVNPTEPNGHVYWVTAVEGSATDAVEPTWPTTAGAIVTTPAGVTYQEANRIAGFFSLAEHLLADVPDEFAAATARIVRPPLHGTASVAQVEGGAWEMKYSPDPDYQGADDSLVYAVCLGLRRPATTCGLATAHFTFPDHLLPQTITFTSTPAAGVAYGDTYVVAATGGGSGNPVTFGVDQLTASVCSIDGTTVTFIGSGLCAIVANQPGDGTYGPATPARQWIMVNTAVLKLQASSSTGIVYGDDVPAVTASYEGFLFDDGEEVVTAAPTCGTTYTKGSPAGWYATTCAGGAATNYQFNYWPGSIVVGKAPLTVTGSGPAVIYGDPVPAIEPAYAGFLFDDTAATAIAVAPACSTEYHQGDPVGSYGTSCYGGDAASYELVHVPGSLAVGPAPLTVSPSTPAGLVYGDPVPTIEPLYAGFLFADDAAALTTVPTCATTYTQGAPPGTYATTCSGASAANYEVTHQPGSFDVGRAPLTIVSEDAYGQYSDPAPPLTARFEGFVMDEDISVLSGTLSCTTTAEITASGQVLSEPGIGYPITCSGLSSDTYEVTYANDGALWLTSEEVAVRLAAGNPVAVPVTSVNGTVSTPELTFKVRVTEVADGTYGDISLVTDDILAAAPFGPGVPLTAPCTVTQVEPATATTPGSIVLTCSLAPGTPIDVYEVSFSVMGPWYGGNDASLLTVFDRTVGNGGTGSGTVAPPVDPDHVVTFTFSASYLKNGTVSGRLVHTTRAADGTVTHVLKGNSMTTMAVAGTQVKITGKATLDGVGNHSYVLSATDNGTSTDPNPTANPDTFGMWVYDPTGVIVFDLSYWPVPVTDGDIVLKVK